MTIKDIRLPFRDYLAEDRKLAPLSIKVYMKCFDRLSIYDNLQQSNITLFLRKNNNQIGRSFLKCFIDFLKLNKDLAEIYNINLNEINDIVIIRQTGRKKKRIIKTISEADLLTLVSNAETEKQKLMLLIQYFAALRINELLTMTYNNIDFNKWALHPEGRGEILVYGKGNKERIAYIESGIMKMLYLYIGNAEIPDDYRDKRLWDYNLKTSWTYNHYDMWLNKFSDKVLGKKYSSHSFRHGRLSQLSADGVPLIYLKQMAGHSSVVSTDIYIENNPERLKQELDKVAIAPHLLIATYNNIEREQQHVANVQQESRESVQDISNTIQQELDQMDIDDTKGEQQEEAIHTEESED